MHGMYVKIVEAQQARLCNSNKSLLPHIATYTHQQGPTNVCSHIPTHRCILFAILTTVTLASTNNALRYDGVTAPKHVGAVLM
jgi:hypothetical protein